MLIKTREDLLVRMARIWACLQAREYVEQFPPGTPAIKIWRSCQRKDWLQYYLQRVENRRYKAELTPLSGGARAEGRCNCQICLAKRVGEELTVEQYQRFFDKKREPLKLP